MPNNKKQHYVPRFLLKSFAVAGSNGRVIGLANLRRKILLKSASISDQCTKDYLYGRDLKMERLLQEVEAPAALAIRRIIERLTLPEEGSVEWRDLLRFIAIQRGRTPGAAREHLEMATKVTREMLREPGPGYVPPPREIVDQLTVTTELAEFKSLQIDASLMPQLNDLADLLVVNDTEIDFVLPDVGVVFFNEWARASGEGVEGFSCHGLQIFLPLSPRHLLIKFDWCVYGADHRGVILARELSDISKINQLMIASSEQNVYFSGLAPTANMLSRFGEHIVSPRSERVRVRKIRRIGGREVAFMHHVESLNVSMSLTFLRQTRLAMFVPNSLRGKLYRWGSLRAPRIGGKVEGPPAYPWWIAQGRYSIESET